MRTVLGRLALAAALIFGAVTAASYLGDLWWGFDLATHFRPQLALAGTVAALAAAVAVARVPAALLFAAALANAAPLLPRVSGATELDCASPRGLRFLTLNLHGRGTDPAAFRDLIADERPDVVLLTEMPRDLAPLTDGPASALPGYRLVDRRGSGFDLALFSRWPFGEWSIDRSAGGHLPVIVADICPGAPATDEANAESRAACLRLVGLHAARPLEGEAKPQDAQLRRAAQFAAAAPDGRVVLLGDLNLTPWSPRFRTLLAEAGLRDAGLEQPLAATWRSPVPLVGLPIDHVLTGPGLTVTCARTGPEVGSDHLPVIADVAPVAPSTGEDAERLALTR
jgi:endonuclease/exonuclease/phosphatase (EEP) superfamily protein YafD